MTYRTGLVGTGFVARSHANGYQQAEGIELVAVADVDDEQLATFGEEWSIDESGQYLDHREMLIREDLDALSVTTPSFLHHDHVLDAIQTDAALKVIWCEKPIALSVADGEDMVHACEEADIELVVNHIRRFSDSYTALRDHLYRGFLGEVESVALQFPRELLRNGTHTVDLLVYLLEESGRQVTGYLTGEHGMTGKTEAAPGEYDDCGGGGSIVFENGTYVSVDHTLPRPHSPATINMVGSKGYLRIDDGGGWEYWRLEETDTEYETEMVKAPLPDSLTVEDRELFAVGAEHVVDLLDGSAENRSPGHEATHVLELLVAMFVSHFTGARVSLPLSAPLRTVELLSW